MLQKGRPRAITPSGVHRRPRKPAAGLMQCGISKVSDFFQSEGDKGVRARATGGSMETDRQIRCGWAETGELERDYHDREWGRPLHDDAKLFEMLILEGMQAGLSWSLILSRRETMRKAFDGFDPVKLALYDDTDIDRLMLDKGVIRNRLKLRSLAENAKAYHRVVARHGSLDAFLWEYVGGKPVVNRWADMSQIPARTEVSDRMSKDMKKLGFKFVGSTIIYAFMQATGMVNDHVTGCFLHDDMPA